MEKTTSLYLSETLKTSNHSITKLIEKYSDELNKIEKLQYEIVKTGGRPTRVFTLNLNQTELLIVLMKNYKNVIKLKEKIIEGKNVIKELEKLENHAKKGCVYLLKKENGLVKIGVSLNPLARIKALQTHFAEKLVDVYISEPTENYKEIEVKCHKFFKEKRVIGEWFNVDLKLAKERIEDFSKIIPKTIVPMVETRSITNENNSK